jgi:endoglycosylceramidase
VFNPELPLTAPTSTSKPDTLAEPTQLVSVPDFVLVRQRDVQFSYSTEEADVLGNFPAGSQTSISVPSVEFPDGYQVSVTGGEVVSTPNAA